MKLHAYRHDVRPQRGQVNHRIALGFHSLAPELADRLIAAAEAREALQVAPTYTHATRSWETASFLLEIVTGDGLGLYETDTLPVVDEIARPAKEGETLSPEEIDAHARWIVETADVRITGAHFEPIRDDRWHYGKQVHDGFIVVDLKGPPFRPFHLQRQQGQATHPVFQGGRFHGYASTEIGAGRALDRLGIKPEHGWKLKNTPLGRVWFPRSADDVAHRLREVRRLAEPLAEACDKLRGLDLSEEPELARELA
ncbi:hypothetical protein, partial [Caenispirillum bisanense]|uniref:hypothetical protein n=1 Tax=Caenispirillum bisanense TaxID=414052 RepID=UPI0031D8C3BE